MTYYFLCGVGCAVAATAACVLGIDRVIVTLSRVIKPKDRKNNPKNGN